MASCQQRPSVLKVVHHWFRASPLCHASTSVSLLYSFRCYIIECSLPSPLLFLPGQLSTPFSYYMTPDYAKKKCAPWCIITLWFARDQSNPSLCSMPLLSLLLAPVIMQNYCCYNANSFQKHFPASRSRLPETRAFSWVKHSLGPFVQVCKQSRLA